MPLFTMKYSTNHFGTMQSLNLSRGLHTWTKLYIPFELIATPTCCVALELLPPLRHYPTPTSPYLRPLLDPVPRASAAKCHW